MVSSRKVGVVLSAAAIGFAGILYGVVRSLSSQSTQLGCVSESAACQSVTAGLSASHFAVGFISAVFSLGIYFLVFHRDREEQVALEQQRIRSREEQVELLSKVLTPGERALLSAVTKEDGILQSSLSRRTNLTPGRVSQVLSGFEDEGLIRREPEGRSMRVYATF